MRRSIMALVGAVSLMVGCLVAEAQSPGPIPQEQLQIEREKLWVEKWKAALTAASIVIPLLAGIYTLYVQTQTAFAIKKAESEAALALKEAESRAAFELKAAEIVLSSSGPAAAKHRAQALRDLFPKRLPDHFAESFDSSRLPGRASEMKLEFCRMLSPNFHPLDILELWKAVYEGERWWLNAPELAPVLARAVAHRPGPSAST